MLMRLLDHKSELLQKDGGQIFKNMGVNIFFFPTTLINYLPLFTTLYSSQQTWGGGLNTPENKITNIYRVLCKFGGSVPRFESLSHLPIFKPFKLKVPATEETLCT